MKTSERGGLALVAVALLGALLAAGGCGPNEEVSGIWDSNTDLPWIDLPENPDPSCYFKDEQQYMRLVLGQYGYDVAGVVQFCPDVLCQYFGERPHCIEVEGGRMRGGTLSFSFHACRAGTTRLRAELKLIPDLDEPRLEGQLFRDGVPYATIRLRGVQKEVVSAAAARCSEFSVPIDDASASAEDVGEAADAAD